MLLGILIGFVVGAAATAWDLQRPRRMYRSKH